MNVGRVCSFRCPKRAVGLSFMLLSAVAFSLMTLVVHLLRREYSPFMIATSRFVINLIAALVMVAVQRPRYGLLGPPGSRLLLTGRGFIGASAMTLVFVATTHLPLGDANAIIFTNPIVTAVLAAAVLGEAFGRLHGLALVLGFGGVVVVVRPVFLFGSDGAASADGVDPLFGMTYEAAAGCAVASSVLAACAYLCVRALGMPGREPVSSAVVVLWFAAAGLVVAPAAALATGQGFQAPTSALSAAALVGVGLLGFVGQWLLNKGLMMEKAGPASAMRNVDVVLAFVFQAALGQRVAWTAVGGAALICCSTLLVAWGKMTEKRGEGDGDGAGEGDGVSLPRLGSDDASVADTAASDDAPSALSGADWRGASGDAESLGGGSGASEDGAGLLLTGGDGAAAAPPPSADAGGWQGGTLGTDVSDDDVEV